jgi:hypothetical protein
MLLDFSVQCIPFSIPHNGFADFSEPLQTEWLLGSECEDISHLHMVEY